MNPHEPKPPSLPAVMSEIERRALDFAQREIAQYRDSSTPWSSGSALSPTASHAMVRSLLQTYDVDGRLWLLMLARLGQRDAIAVLERLIREYKSQSQHIPLPSELAAWDMETRMFGIPAPPQGPKKAARMLRDLCIMTTTMALVDRFGLPRTKRSASGRCSASQIMALALESANIFMGHKAVEKIVDRYRGAWPTVPGWASK